MIYAKNVWFEGDRIYVELNDSRIVSTPVAWYPNLRKGTPEQWAKYELWNGGRWIHWEELDEDLSAEGFLSAEQNESIGKITRVWFDDANIYVVLDNGHTIGNLLLEYERLQNATPEQRRKYEIGPRGESLHWEEINEDLSLESFFDFKRELNYAKI